jgi:PAS domain S-box-containing protein
VHGTIDVLHVDDDPDFLDLSATLLERENEQFRVETASSASEGHDHLATTPVDCLVSDYEMPRVNGIEFLEAVREEYPDLPFILFTGKGSERVASDAISSGATDYIQKTGGTEQYTILANRIENVVEQYRARRRSERANKRRRRTLRRITDGFTQMDESLTITDVNKQAVEFADYSREELIGMNYRTLQSDGCDETFIEAYETALETGESQTIVARSDLSQNRWVDERIFPAEDGDGLFVYFRDITERKRREEFQGIIIDISAELIEADATDIDECIEEVLCRIGQFERAKRSYIFQFDDSERVMDNTHEWSASGVEPQKPDLQGLDTEPFAWFIPQIRHQEVVTVPSVADLPAEANRLQRALTGGNVESMVAVPLSRSGALLGFIGFDWTSAQEPWSEDTIDLLRISGNIIASALAREQTLSGKADHDY